MGLKTKNGLATASIKTFGGLARASVSTVQGLEVGPSDTLIADLIADGATLILDAILTPVGSVATYEDQSSDGNDFTQPTGSSQPTRTSAGGRDLVRCDGIDDYFTSSLTYGDVIGDGSAWTLFFAGAVNGPFASALPAYGCCPIIGGGPFSTWGLVLKEVGGIDKLIACHPSDGFPETVAVVAPAPGVPFVATVKYDGTTLSLALDDGTTSSAARGLVTDPSELLRPLGMWTSDGAGRFDGDEYLKAVIPTALSGPTVTTRVAQIKARYAIP